MKHSSFTIGLILLLISSIWISVVFLSGEKISSSHNLDVKETTSIDLGLKGKGLGFYVITISDYSKQIVFVKVLDPHGDFISAKRIATKMSVNYFEFNQNGKYTLEITNLSEKPVIIKAEFGNTRSSEFMFPLLVSFMGVNFLAFSGYKRLRNHKTAQPEENRS